MRSNRSNFDLVEHTDEPLDEVDYICIAADLLQQMLSELRWLATGNADLADALSGRGSDLGALLWTLHETVELLIGAHDPSMAIPQRRRAIALISWLSHEFDALMYEVQSS
jgi:hypothetical protein